MNFFSCCFEVPNDNDENKQEKKSLKEKNKIPEKYFNTMNFSNENKDKKDEKNKENNYNDESSEDGIFNFDEEHYNNNKIKK